MKKTREVCLCGAMMLLMVFPVMAASPCIEANGPLLTYIQQIAGRDAPWNKNYNRKTREVVQFVEKMEQAIRQTSEAMKRMAELQTHAEALKSGTAKGKPGGTFKEVGELVDSGEYDENGNPIKEADYVHKYGDPSNMLKYTRGVAAGVFRGGYARSAEKLRFKRNYIMRIKSMGKTIEVPELIMQPPYWLPEEKGAKPSSWKGKDSKKFLIKIKAKYQSALVQQKNVRDLEKEVNGLAQILLPDQLLNNFNPQLLVQRLFAKAGVVRLTERLTLRPATPQDGVFTKYAGLASKSSDALLFWSDPMVVGGYHPLFGTSLNKTDLKGCKMLDMDGVVSRGYSVLIDQENRLRPPDEQIKNPFKGYASKVIPGLIVMAQEGRIPIDTEPTDEQLEEALKVSKKQKVLPSQNSKNIKKVSSGGVRFHYPARIIRVAEEEDPFDKKDGDVGIGHLDDAVVEDAPQGAVELGKFDKEVYLGEMRMMRRRLKEIDALKKINRMGYEYTNVILESYIQMAKEADQVSKIMIGWQEVSPLSKTDGDGSVQKSNKIMVPMASIPEITQLRKAIALGIEKQRDVLSDLQHEYDDLKQKEWLLLERVSQTRKEAITKLMNSAPVYYRTIIMKDS